MVPDRAHRRDGRALVEKLPHALPRPRRTASLNVQLKSPVDLDLSHTPLEDLDEEILPKRLEFLHQRAREGEG
jgi:hypothetical protein